MQKAKLQVREFEAHGERWEAIRHPSRKSQPSLGHAARVAITMSVLGMGSGFLVERSAQLFEQYIHQLHTGRGRIDQPHQE
jgi:hypothetical protein